MGQSIIFLTKTTANNFKQTAGVITPVYMRGQILRSFYGNKQKITSPAVY